MLGNSSHSPSDWCVPRWSTVSSHLQYSDEHLGILATPSVNPTTGLNVFSMQMILAWTTSYHLGNLCTVSQHDLTLSRNKLNLKPLWWSEMSWQKIQTETRCHWFSAANRATQQADNVKKETELKSLQQLGQMRATIQDGARLWWKAV